MKTTKISLILLITISVLSISCDRENSRLDDLNNVSEEEAVELVQESLVSDVYGINIRTTDAISLENNSSSKSFNECGILNERSFVRNGTTSSNITFDHDIDYTFRLICESEVPTLYTIDFFSTGTYSAPRMDSNDTIDYDASLANIRDTEGPFIYNGTFTREGTQTTRIAGNTKDFNSVLAIETTNVTIDKQTRIVLSGTSTFSLIGTTGAGNDFTYEGQVEYLGNGAARVEVNGNIYNVSL